MSHWHGRAGVPEIIENGRRLFAFALTPKTLIWLQSTVASIIQCWRFIRRTYPRWRSIAGPTLFYPFGTEVLQYSLSIGAMYLRAVHAETHLEPLIALIQQNPLGLLTTAVTSENHPLIQHTHLPWVIDPPTNLDALESSGQADAKPVGNVKQPVLGLEGCKLRGHMARANPHSKALMEGVGAGNGKVGTEVTVSFRLEDQHYITPKWYVQTKPETGKVVPTWNYAAVEVRGVAKLLHDKEDPETSKYLQTQVEELTRLSEGSLGYDTRPKAELKQNEAGGEGRGTAWEVDDAPEAYVEIMKKAIIGIEIEVSSVVGKWKMSQELKDGDRAGVKTGLNARNDERSAAVAKLVDVRSNGA